MSKHIHVHVGGRKTRDLDPSNDSEESEAYIKGNKDAMAGKPKDPAFHPGGTKKPAVCLQYAEGYQQGVDDKKRGTKDSFPTSISIRGRKYVSAGKLRKGDDDGQQAGFEELDASGARTGRMVWLTTAGKVVNDDPNQVTTGIRG